MATITTLNDGITGASFRGQVNTNFANLNTDKAETSALTAGLATKQDTISGLTASGAELNILDGATLSTTELNYVDGVTSAIQTQLDGKQGDITLTTTGTSGAATLIGDNLNIPQYSGGGGSVATDAIWDAKGDLVIGTGANTASRLAIGANGTVPIADTAEVTGVRWGTVSGTGDVTSATTIADNALVRGDGGAKGVQSSGIVVSDTDTLSNVNSVIFDTTHTGSPVEGEMYWDNTEKTVSIKTGLDTVTLQVGREEHILVRNNTGSTILNGKAVYVTGSSTNPTIALAQANDYTKSSKTIGVTTMDIPNGTDGLVTILGLVHDMDTSGFTAGDVLYLDSSTSGGIVNANPTGINYSLELGMCITSHATTGIVFVATKSLKAFPSDEFKVTDATDKTKQITFGVSGVSAGTKRTLTVPNADTTLVGTGTTDTLTNKSISLGTNTVTSTFAQLNTAVTDADLARTDAANTFTGTQTITQIELGNTDTSITRSAAGVMAVEGVVVPTISSTSTLTNKRITTRIGTEASSATSTPTADTVDQWNVTALAVADTFAAPTGTPTDGQTLIIRIKDNGTARVLAWNAIYRASSDLALPLTTVISKTLYLGFRYNAADSKWDLLALLNNI